MIIQKLVLILLLCIAIPGYSATIEGFAPEFVGKKVSLITYSDYLTMTKVEIGNGEVDPKDSTFKISYSVKQTIKAVLEIGNTEAEIYLAPETDYRIYYKKQEDSPVSFAKQKASTYFVGVDSTDINYKILQYHDWFDKYIYLQRDSIMKYGFAPYIDTFKQYAYEAYVNEKNSYFINYVRFDIANLELTKFNTRYMRTTPQLYKEYIEPFPVYPYNDKYMTFLKVIYDVDFSDFHTQAQSDIILAFDDSSPTALMTAMSKYQIYVKEELRQLVMVKMLGTAYTKNQYPRKNIRTMLDSVRLFSKYPENRVAADNMIEYLTKVDTGYPAPTFSETDNHGETITWAKYNGKFIYINFFTTWNADAVNEMKLMEDLYVKFSDYIEFVSICMDKDSANYQSFVNNHENITWPIVYVGEDHQLVKDFKVQASPHYILLDQEGFIAMSPAQSPSPDGVYKTVEETFYYIKAQLLKISRN